MICLQIIGGIFGFGSVSVSEIFSIPAAKAAEGINQAINYQGKLMDSTGNPVADGSYDIKFTLYTAEIGGTQLWTASSTNGLPAGTPAAISVSVVSGLFSLLLGDVSDNQVAFPEGLFNNDTLYLGVTIGADSEMTPRKRLSAVPYAFNSQTLQGQYASNTVANTGGDLFALRQASTDSAASTRTALYIETKGTSNLNDFLIRAGDSISDVFTISRQGNVTTTGNLTVDGETKLNNTLNVSATSTLADMALIGRVNSNLLPYTTDAYTLGNSTYRWLGVTAQNINAVNVSSTNIDTLGYVSTTNLYSNTANLGNATTTNLYNSGTVSTTALYVNGVAITGAGATPTWQQVTDVGATTNDWIQFAGATSTENIVPNLTNSLTLGTENYQWLGIFAQNADFTNVSSTNLDASGYIVTNNLTATDADLTYVSSTNVDASGYISADSLISNSANLGDATSTNLYNSGTVSTTNLFVNGVAVNGIESQDLQAVTDLGVATTNWLQFNGATSTDHFLPGTNNLYNLGSLAYRWANLFAVNGNFTGTVTTTNLFASGYVSTTNLYVNGTQITGATPTLQNVTDAGYVTTNPIRVAGVTSTGHILPATNIAYDLGSSANRWNNVWSAEVHVGTSTWDLAQADNGRFTLSNSGNERFTILSTGNVGINDTNPAERLVVGGNIRLQANGNIDTSAAGTLTIGGTTQTGLTMGRTGAATTLSGSNFTNGGLAYGASNQLTFTSAGTAGMAVMSGGTGAPTFGTLGLTYGGTNANLSGVATGGILYKGATAIAGTGALTGVLKGNGSGAPTAMTGTANRVSYWSDANTLGTSNLVLSGNNVYPNSAGSLGLTGNRFSDAYLSGNLYATGTVQGGTIRSYGNLRVDGTTTLNTVEYTWPGVSTNGLLRNTGGTLTWDPATYLTAVAGTSLTSANLWVGNASNQAAAVAMSGDATISNTGAVTVVNDSHTHTASTISGLSTADFTSANISQWTNDAGYITGVAGQSLTSANLWVGNGSNLAAAVTMSGDGTLSNAGVLTVNDNSHSHDGTTIYGLTTADFSSANISQWTNDAGYLTSLGNAFIDGGNSFGNTGDLGTNDAFALNFRTNNATRVTIDTTGNIYPAANTYNLGLATNRWGSAYLNGNLYATGTVQGGTIRSYGNLRVDGTTTLNTVEYTWPGASTNGLLRNTGGTLTWDPATYLTAVAGTSLTSANLWVGNASNQAAAVAMSGDATISNTGAVTVVNDSHTHTASTISGLSTADFTSANISQWTNDAGYITGVAGQSLASANLWVGNGSNLAAAVSMSGDGTISNTGVLTVNNDSHAHTASTISGLSPADFTTNAVSQWTNDAGYLTSFTETDPTWTGTADTTGSIGRTGSVAIGKTNPSTTLEVYGTTRLGKAGDTVSGDTILDLYFDRPWSFKQDGDDATSALALEASTDGKAFKIKSNTGAYSPFVIQTSSVAPGSNTINIGENSLFVVNQGNVGVGNTSPGSLLTVGASSQFQVNSSGNLIRINNIPYSWPSANAAGALSNDGSGNLTWTPGGVSGTGTDNRITRWNGTGAVQNSLITIDDSGYLYPSVNNSYDLGISTNAWRNAYIASSVNIGYQGSSNVRFSKTGYFTSSPSYNAGGIDGIGFAFVVTSTMGSNNSLFALTDKDYNVALFAKNATHTAIAGDWLQDFALTVGGNVGPYTNLAHDLGSSSNRWNNIWGATVHVGTSTWDLSQASNGNFTLANSGTNYIKMDQTASRGIFVGGQAGYRNTTGAGNTAMGYQSLYPNQTGNYNTAVGYQTIYAAGGAANSSSYNSALGYRAMYSNTTGASNTAFGYEALYSNATGLWNVAVGNQALRNSGSAIIGNIAVGHQALYNQNENGGIAIGALSQYSSTNGYANISIGGASLYSNLTGDRLIAIGESSLYSNTASDNMAMGWEALTNNTSGSFNTGIGQSAGHYNETGSKNTSLGHEALRGASIGGTANASNTAIGYRALFGVSSGNNNTAVGHEALNFNTSGYDNTALGANALNSLTTGYSNVAIGKYSLFSSIDDFANIGIGTGSLYNITNNNNVGLGHNTLYLTGNSAGNVAVGGYAGNSYANGSYNTFIGFNADSAAAGYANAMALGWGAIAPGSNQIRIGNTSVTNIYAQVGITPTSDIRMKDNIIDNTLGLNYITRLHPVNFTWKDSTDLRIQDGLVAQELAVVEDELGISTTILDDVAYNNSSGTAMYGIRYDLLTIPLINATKEIYSSSSPLWNGVSIDPNFAALEEPFMQVDQDGNIAYKGVSITSQGIATSSTQAFDSFTFSYKGSAWNTDTAQEITTSFDVFNNTISATSSELKFIYTTGTGFAEDLLTISNSGDVHVSGDLHVGRRLYLGSKVNGEASTSTYIFVDDTLSPTSTYIATNADGWQTETTYDYAERYESSEDLIPGDLVTVDTTGINKVKRATSPTDPLMGIVSTKPGFVTGRHYEGWYPVALAGRVPTRVSTKNGAIQAGDYITASDIPGVGVKTTDQSNVIGIALEPYSSSEEGLISVFVKNVGTSQESNTTIVYGPEQPLAEVDIKGFAVITAGSKEVKVTFASINAFPHVKLTPYGSMDGSYWLSEVKDTGFTIVLSNEQAHDLMISYEVTLPTTLDVNLTSGETGEMDELTGVVVYPEIQEPEPSAEPDPAVEAPSEPVENPAPEEQALLENLNLDLSTTTANM